MLNLDLLDLLYLSENMVLDILYLRLSHLCICDNSFTVAPYVNLWAVFAIFSVSFIFILIYFSFTQLDWTNQKCYAQINSLYEA